jgi:hypothetical protein
MPELEPHAFVLRLRGNLAGSKLRCNKYELFNVMLGGKEMDMEEISSSYIYIYIYISVTVIQGGPLDHAGSEEAN